MEAKNEDQRKKEKSDKNIIQEENANENII